MSETAAVIGIDLAWGEKNPDGITALSFSEGIENPPTEVRTELVFGDNQLLRWISRYEAAERLVIAIDAPTICNNADGSRKVDKECSAEFRAAEAGCHPVNRSLCDRPFRIADRLTESGYQLTTDLEKSPRIVCEVFPHPAIVRFFGLEKTIKYKKGKVADRAIEFRRYQTLLTEFLAKEMPSVLKSHEHIELLSRPWGKTCEDLTDSILCALVGYWHLRYREERSQIFGNDSEGHILVPAPLGKSSSRS